MKAIAPGKIIISGEHSVVYGQSALVMAVNRFAICSISQSNSGKIEIAMNDFKENIRLDQTEFEFCARYVRERFNRFLQGELPITQVADKPFQVFVFLANSFFTQYLDRSFKDIHIQIHSCIPIGCGMGSSAATCAAVITGLNRYFNKNICKPDLYEHILQSEKLLHGYPSGVDPYITLNGGFVRFQNKNVVSLAHEMPDFYLINTGTPLSSTGECVAYVAKHYKDSSIWGDFAQITEKIQTAIEIRDEPVFRDSILENHNLLVKLNLVPERVQSFIKEFTEIGGWAKMSGAGTLSGDQAGIVLCFGKSPVELCYKYGYKMIKVKGDRDGARIVHHSGTG